MNKTKQLITLIPFIQTYSSSVKNPLKIKTIQRHLGKTLYPRISMIYKNVVEAIVQQKYQYLNVSMSPQLSQYLIMQINYLKSHGYKIKLSQPKIQLVQKKSFMFDQKIWNDHNMYLSIVCNIYFGLNFNIENPMAIEKNQRLYKIGRHRYIAYNTELSFGENIKKIWKNHIIQFKVKCQSNYYIQLFDVMNQNVLKQKLENQSSRYNKTSQRTVITQITLRTSQQKFDWIIVDINDINKNIKDTSHIK